MYSLVWLGAYGALALLLVRFVLAAIFFVHGRTKWALWNTNDPKPMKGVMKLLSVVEPLGGLAMLLGFLTRWAGLGLAVIMLGAMYMKISKWQRKFAGDGGWEFDLAILALVVAVLILGAGAYSLDRLWFGW